MGGRRRPGRSRRRGARRSRIGVPVGAGRPNGWGTVPPCAAWLNPGGGGPRACSGLVCPHMMEMSPTAARGTDGCRMPRYLPRRRGDSPAAELLDVVSPAHAGMDQTRTSETSKQFPPRTRGLIKAGPLETSKQSPRARAGWIETSRSKSVRVTWSPRRRRWTKGPALSPVPSCSPSTPAGHSFRSRCFFPVGGCHR